MRIRTDKPRLVTADYGNGRVIKSCRYLRKVPCYLSSCNQGCNKDKDFRLPANINALCIVDTDYVIQYHEVFEKITNWGIIMTMSSLIFIQNTNRQLYSLIKRLIEDSTVTLFHNVFDKDCIVEPVQKEDTNTFVTRENCAAAHYYKRHTNGEVNVVFLSSNTKMSLQQINQHDTIFGIEPQDSVKVKNMTEFLMEFQPENDMANDLVNGLDAALDNDHAVDEEAKDLFKDYLATEILGSLNKGEFVRGVLRVNKFKSRDEAFVQVSEGQSTKQMVGAKNDIMVLGKNRNRAIHGDVVVVQLLPQTAWKSRLPDIATSEAVPNSEEPLVDLDNAVSEVTIVGSNVTPVGRVVGVHKRNWRDYVCSYEESEKNRGRYILVTPYDRRIPRIRIAVSENDRLKDMRFVVRIDNWPVTSTYPNGHFVENLGKIGIIETETRTLLTEYNLYNRAFSAAQLAELPINTPEAPWQMDTTEVAKRRDLRNLLVFSIDPAGCQDVDDALSVRKLPTGGYELGVHIADVSQFVKYDSLLDLEARRRSTSIYMSHKRFDMLPHVLSGDLCSLWSGVDRYAVSVIWKLSESLEVESVEFGRSVIRSRYKLAYETAQDIHDGKLGNAEQAASIIPELAAMSPQQRETQFAEMRTAIIQLQAVATVIKSKRAAVGGLQLDSVEVAFHFSDSDRTQLEDLRPKEPLAMHETIAECMIFANHWVAKRIAEVYPAQACLRRHPPPRMDHFGELLHCARSRGFEIDVSTNLGLAQSLDRACDPTDPEVNKILRGLTTLAMSNAEYFCTASLPDDKHFHYGLALPQYTHFTSPIRRYADIIVHRLLLSAVDNVPESHLLPGSKLAEQCEVMNRQHHQAQLVQRASTELFQALYFQSRSEEAAAMPVDAVVVQLRANGFYVQVPRFGIRGSVLLGPRPGAEGNEGMRVEASTTAGVVSRVAVVNSDGVVKDEYRLFDRVMVRVRVAESRSHGLALQLELTGRSTAQARPPMPQLQDEDILQVIRQMEAAPVTTVVEKTPEQMIAGMHTADSMYNVFYFLEKHVKQMS